MLNLAICDNEPAIIEELEEYLDKISDISFDYEVFFSAEELYSYKKKQELDFDVYILDIEMGEMSGLELAKKLRQDSPHSLIVFLTSFSKYVYDVFEVVTFDFILKPVSFENFSKVLHKACDFLCMAKVNFVFSYRKNSYSIPCQSIVYIEKLGNCSNFLLSEIDIVPSFLAIFTIIVITKTLTNIIVITTFLTLSLIFIVSFLKLEKN